MRRPVERFSSFHMTHSGKLVLVDNAICIKKAALPSSLIFLFFIFIFIFDTGIWMLDAGLNGTKLDDTRLYNTGLDNTGLDNTELDNTELDTTLDWTTLD
ncbi:hypothetical protein SS1G_01365 [Sclerotinia sclerotiorum 1980 UF-70]|uniref:Uncharacterized protein n=1 Tax=Sclerotinia sclerotiorum (strain ATCC 18683 / 1980 / Ss-1) TaxID=665079 RepID=A7E7T7_SCLS1|nr:hypothetical protein SS1G_01365 [Sclerotinia sclerotiorum 1980 UF-70]EDN96439.1 hypothetical protein SS1G_01365 [Sclerotinia sclerotiorum 1980 UF-70]